MRLISTILLCVAATLCTAQVDELPPIGSGTPKPFVLELPMRKVGLLRGTHTLPFTAQDDEWHPLQGGSGAQDLYLTNRPRLDPSLTVVVTDEGHISDCTVELGKDAFAVPAFTVTFSTDRHNSTPAFHHEAHISAAAKSYPFKLPDSLSVVEMLPDEVVVTLKFAPQYTSSFIATVERGIPLNVVDSGEMHDLVPHNSTMGMKFVFRVHKPANEKRLMSVWASRKPPLPDFTLILTVNNTVFAQINIESDANSTDAQGFDVDISTAFDNLLNTSVSFVAHFYEARRHNVAHLRIPNLRSLVKELSEASEATTRVITSSSPELALRFYARPGSNLGLSVLQPGPMRDLLLSMYYIEPSGTRTLFLREGDLLVPASAHTDAQQYGWDDAIPAAVESMTSNGRDFFDAPFEFDVAYNVPDGRWDSGFLLQEWIASYGGDASAVDVSFLDEKQHSYHTKHLLKTTRGVEAGQSIVSVPYDTMLTTAHIARNQWIQALEKHTAAHQDHVREHNIMPEAAKVMEMSAVVMLQLFDESTNFRVLFNTFRASSFKLPVVFSAEEMAVFGFDPNIAHEVDRMKRLWTVEYETLSSATASLPRGFTKNDYFHIRAQVDSRLINMTEQLVLTPVLDLATHDEDPTAVLEYDDTNNRAVIVARRPLAAGKPVTLDYGVKQKTKLDFLLQYGFVPMNAISSVTWRFNNSYGHSLTTEKASRRGIIDWYAQKFAGEGGEVTAAHEDQAMAMFTRELGERRATVEKWNAPAGAQKSIPDVLVLSDRLRLAMLDVLHHHQGFAAADANGD